MENTYNNHSVNLLLLSSHALNGYTSKNITNNIKQSMMFSPTNEEEVIGTFINLKGGKTEDTYDLQIRPNKCLIKLIASAVTHILNLALSRSPFPELMQIAKNNSTA